ncbi:hypothetical protein Tco_1118239, partial [Tanacetum coccineum]
SSKPSTPPTIEQSLAKLGDSIDKLKLVTKRLVAKRLAASTTNLVSITSQTTFTKDESNDHTSNIKTDITEPTTAVVAAQNTTTVNDSTTPPNTQPNIIMPLPNNNGQIHTPTPKNPMAKLLIVSVSSMNKIEKEVDTQSQTPIFVLPTLPANPTHNIPKVRHDIAVFQRTNLHEIFETYGLVMLIGNKLTPERVWFSPSNRPLPLNPPKFVMLDPPWEQHDPRYITMSLEDKTRFQDGSIDTYPCLVTK